LVHGDVLVVASGAWLPTAKLVNEVLVGGPRDERDDNVCVDDVREGIALLGEPANVVLQGLARILFAALEVPGVSRVQLRLFEIPDEDLFELCPATDVVRRQKFEAHSNVLPDTDGGTG
jgi:hypothetical protein